MKVMHASAGAGLRPGLSGKLRVGAAQLGKVLALVALMTMPGIPAVAAEAGEWLLIDDFEADNPLQHWHLHDTDNQTSPRLERPQVTEIDSEEASDNHFLRKKPAAEGIVGNRKALSFRSLPVAVEVGETYTFYTRIQVEAFPNNHIFGLTGLDAAGILEHNYDALEPSLRVTDKRESNGFVNDGTLMVTKGGGYEKIHNSRENRVARPLETGVWYEFWYVVNNARLAEGGQKYDVYARGGEFLSQQEVFTDADFRMSRELPLRSFLTNCNTGPLEAPYGNGGLRYDDLYMARGRLLTTPVDLRWQNLGYE